MKLGIICGSHRLESQSSKIAKAVQRTLEEQGLCEEVFLFDLRGNPLPLWDEGIWSDDPAWQERLAPIAAELRSCDGLVVISPEWHGMVPAGLKNFFLLWGGGELAHKPALIVTVSAGEGGAYPVAELRMSSYKNNRLCYLPEHLIIRRVETVFNELDTDNDDHAQDYLQRRIVYALRQLREYALAFRQIRASEAVALDEFSNGM